MLEDGWAKILGLGPKAGKVAFHSLPTCLYSFATTAAVQALGLNTFKTMTPWAGQGLQADHLDWLEHTCSNPADVVVTRETTVPLSVFPCGSYGSKWDRSGSYIMSCLLYTSDAADE